MQRLYNAVATLLQYQAVFMKTLPQRFYYVSMQRHCDIGDVKKRNKIPAATFKKLAATFFRKYNVAATFENKTLLRRQKINVAATY